ncbi:30S ribosomal protein S12 methylthiotransferase RimO [Thermodesulfobacteriota bacterium B35]
MKTIHLVSLGCAKNLVDSEVMLGILEKEGYRVAEDPEEADLILVNTCGFIRPAVEEAVDEILRLAEVKERCPGVRLVVTGCLVQRYGRELVAELPEVDLFVGISGVPRIGELVRNLAGSGSPALELQPPDYLMDRRTPRRVSTPFFRSFLKITEGCSNRCTYCMIPAIRGNLRSRTIADLTAEAAGLEAAGVRELTLIAQDLTAYGNDLDRETDLVRLVEHLLAGTSIPWLRLLYLYPSTVPDALIRLMASSPRIVPYLDIPFQHVSDPVLARMHRRYGGRDLDQLLARIREELPHCALRTTLLVGFPGETRGDVDAMVSFLQRWRLDHVGVFRYQDEEGSAASALDGKVPAAEKEERYARIMEVQAAISREKQQQYVGRVEPVLVEGLSRESDLLLEGRTRFQAPEIDGCVYITAGTARPGEIVPVRITDAHPYDLVGEIESAPSRDD